MAARFYLRHGYQVIDRNYRTRMGELDIVALKKDVLVFAEVKTRGEGAISTPAEAVTVQKQQRLIRAAQHYIMTHPSYSEHFMRFDVVEVFLPRMGLARVRCIEDAFTL